jgi:hypothetical protein
MSDTKVVHFVCWENKQGYAYANPKPYSEASKENAVSHAKEVKKGPTVRRAFVRTVRMTTLKEEDV